MSFLYQRRQDGYVFVTINRPMALNALNVALLEELSTFLESETQRSETKVVILTGMDDKAFVAGADIKEMQPMSTTEIEQFCLLGQKVANQLDEAPFLTVAAVNGYALGGGFEMALACDMMIASSQATFGFPEVKLGLIPGFGGTQRLTRTIGTRLALELITSGKTISASRAFELGIVSKIVEPSTLYQESMQMATEMANYSSTALKAAKRAVKQGIELPISQALDLEKELFLRCFATEERAAAMRAFIEKRKS